MTLPDHRILPAAQMLDQFLKEKPGARKWLETPGLSVYVRKGFHADENSTIVDTLDIANVDAYPQSQGIFTSFLLYTEQVSHLPIFIENVLETRFGKFFERRGYLWIPQTYPPCFIFRKELSQD